MKERVPTVYIVDDDNGIRSSIRVLMKSVGMPALTFSSAEEFLRGYLPAQPGCAVVDIRMPGMNGLELQQQLTERGALIPVIFITGHGDIPMAVEAMRNGAFEFLQKPFRDQDLIDSVQKALVRDKESRAALTEHGHIRACIDSLTPREREVLDLLTAGKANKSMAADLGLSQRTVEIHRAHVMEKMGARSIAQLVRMVMDLEHRGTPAAR
jgi:FixJ family two-component response regulator